MTRVLIVDDERFFREAVRDALAELSLRCELAESGEEALKLAEDPRVEAVVLDLRLPGASGIEVLRALRETRPGLRVIVLSAPSDQGLVLEALRLGAADYLAKPIHDEELRLAVTRALEGTRLASRLASLRERLARLADAQAELASRADLDEPGRLAPLAQPAVAALAEVTGAARTSWLVAEDDRLQVLAIQGAELPAEDLPPSAVAESVAGLALGPAETDRVQRIDDVARDERCAGLPRRGRYATGAALLAPLRVGGRVLGVLCAADPRARKRFGEEDELLMRLFALGLGALQAASLAPPAPVEEPPEEVVQAEVAPAPAPVEAPPLPAAAPDPGESLHLELLRAACEAMTTEVEPELLLRAALGPVAEGLRAAAAIYEIDPREGDLALRAQQEWDGRQDRARLPRDRGLTALALQTGRLVATGRPEQDARFDRDTDTPADGGAGPLLVLPLSVRGRVLGVARIHPEAPEAASARTGEFLCAALSAALRNTLLYGSLLEAVDDLAAARRNPGGSLG